MAARWIALLFVCCVVRPRGGRCRRAPDLVLRGDGHARTTHQTYRLVPFDVPADVKAIEVKFDYTGREARTTIDSGCSGRERSSSKRFAAGAAATSSPSIVSSLDATPSYLAAPVTPGRWNLLLGIPNIRAGQVVAVHGGDLLHARGRISGCHSSPSHLAARSGWYRGDLHMHSHHSDGSCASKSGSQRVPCPLFLTLDAAADHGLDFVAVTEHNTILACARADGAAAVLRSPAADSRDGDDDVPGTCECIQPARAGRLSRRQRAGAGLEHAAHAAAGAQGALVSINHPNVPSGEGCMGCGWRRSRLRTVASCRLSRS